jgi:hypothetical protein
MLADLKTERLGNSAFLRGMLVLKGVFAGLLVKNWFVVRSFALTGETRSQSERENRNDRAGHQHDCGWLPTPTGADAVRANISLVVIRTTPRKPTTES